MYQHIAQLVSVDCIIFGYENDELKLLVFKRWIEPCKGKLSLLGGWVNPDESVTDAARRVLKLISGLNDIYLEQVDVFSEVGRDPGGRVISIAYYALMTIDEQNQKLIEQHSAQWVPYNKKPGLIFDHDTMVEKALEKLRMKASYNLIGEHLLPEKFTLLQLRKLYNAIFQKEFDPGNFRKKVLSLKLLEQLSEKDTTESKRGAYFYRFKKKDHANFSNQIFRVE
ncbi:MAG TPA: DNA mismatch repair protein MutT [Prolixibacteraceae bacterium]|nr:DNA mismatch repair protein MutT [Prolixibacteraceae bacterium]